ncbi:hypothetical protein NDU88_004853 [Pleurodeles waltl]|uniref:Uncharacterized protein n=1 Tax=Pleurodeles waltl TaxID=8319 RepID=A0AAV7RMN3_PLEWA|nr:hypothetical protein NDU88_004853 [Pleurodeles waltl]
MYLVRSMTVRFPEEPSESHVLMVMLDPCSHRGPISSLYGALMEDRRTDSWNGDLDVPLMDREWKRTRALKQETASNAWFKRQSVVTSTEPTGCCNCYIRLPKQGEWEVAVAKDTEKQPDQQTWISLPLGPEEVTNAET